MGQIYLTMTWIRGESRPPFHSTSLQRYVLFPTPALNLREAGIGTFLLIVSELLFACPRWPAVVNQARRDLPVTWRWPAFILTPARSAYLQDEANNPKKAESDRT